MQEKNENSERNEVEQCGGRMLGKKKAVKGILCKFDACEGEGIVTCMGMIGGGWRVHGQKEIKRDEMMKAIENLKNVKAAGVDGLTADKLKSR